MDTSKQLQQQVQEYPARQRYHGLRNYHDSAHKKRNFPDLVQDGTFMRVESKPCPSGDQEIRSKDRL